MADRRRLVTLNGAGVATTVVDLEQPLTGPIMTERDSFQIVPPERRTVATQLVRRYGGSRTVHETHDNGQLRQTLLVLGASEQDCLDKASTVLRAVEDPVANLYYEWRPDGTSQSTFYEITGSGAWASRYQWSALVGAFALSVDLALPVAPLALLAPVTTAISSTVLPAVVQLATTGGDAPGLMSVNLRHSGGAAAPVWALMGWWQRPTVSPLASSVAPVGIIEAETAVALSTWAVAANAGARGGNQLFTNGAGPATVSASWVVDPSVMVPDDFSGEIAIEVWGRFQYAANLVSPRAVLSLTRDDGFGGQSFTPEFGSSGCALPVVTGTAYRRSRLGTLVMPVDPSERVKYRVKLDGSWASGSGGFGLDYLELVPSRAAARGISGVPLDTSYPRFMTSTADTQKTIRADLSGYVGSGAGAAGVTLGRDRGLAGALMWPDRGNTDLLLHLSSLVPDDPTVDATSEQLAHTVTGTVTVFPRVHLAAIT